MLISEGKSCQYVRELWNVAMNAASDGTMGGVSQPQSKRTCWRLFSSQMTIISISHSLHIIKELRILMKEKREVV